MFKKMDRFLESLFFPITFYENLERQLAFLKQIKSRNMSIDDAIAVTEKALREDLKCDLLI